MKRMLWLASWYPNKFQPFTGDFIQRHAQAVSLHQPVHVIFVVKDGEGKFTRDVKIENYDNHNLTEVIAYYKPRKSGVAVLDRFLSMAKYFRVNLQLIGLYTKQFGRPVLVHVHVALWAGLLALWLKRRYGTRYIVTEHWTGYHKSSPDNIYKRGFLFRKLTRLVLKNADMLLPVSNQLGQVINKNVGNIRFHVTPNVVNTRYFRYEAFQSSQFRFIHVSTMNYQKNMEGILKVLSRLLADEKNWMLTAIGPAGHELKKYAASLGLENNVQWKGELTYEQVASEMKRSSAMIMFSRYENMPCVILEAQCCGLPVMSTSVGGIAEVVNRDNGILVSAGDENQLLKAVTAVINQEVVFNRQEIADCALQKYSYHAVAQQITMIYDEMLKKPG